MNAPGSSALYNNLLRDLIRSFGSSNVIKYSSDLSEDFIVLVSRGDDERGLWPIQRHVSAVHHVFDASKQLSRSCHGPTPHAPDRARRRDPGLRRRLAYIRTSRRRGHLDFFGQKSSNCSPNAMFMRWHLRQSLESSQIPLT
jgi:hypothetical protein